MAIGFTANGICYSTKQLATDAYFQNIKPSILVSTSNTIFVEPIKLASGVWQWKKSTQSSTGVVTNHYSINALTPINGSCVIDAGTYNYADAASLWAFAFVTVISFWYLAKNLGMIIDAVRRW